MKLSKNNKSSSKLHKLCVCIYEIEINFEFRPHSSPHISLYVYKYHKILGGGNLTCRILLVTSTSQKEYTTVALQPDTMDTFICDRPTC